MMGFRYAALTVLAASLGACAFPVRYALRDTPAYSLSVWLDKESLLDPEDALKSCAEWLPKGVVCRLAEDEDSADVRVSAADDECLPDKDGMRTLALAFRGGRIVFNSRCFRQSDGSYDRHMFRAVMTHELGHEIGIWTHVPGDCDKDTPKHPNGQQVCGIAVMNKTYDGSVWFITVIDAMAFDMRDRANSSLSPLVAGDREGSSTNEPPYCVYRAK
jgi:hypothetical protein